MMRSVAPTSRTVFFEDLRELEDSGEVIKNIAPLFAKPVNSGLDTNNIPLNNLPAVISLMYHDMMYRLLTMPNHEAISNSIEDNELMKIDGTDKVMDNSEIIIDDLNIQFRDDTGLVSFYRKKIRRAVALAKIEYLRSVNEFNKLENVIPIKKNIN